MNHPVHIAAHLNASLGLKNVFITTDRDFYLICDRDLNLLHRLTIAFTSPARLTAHALNFSTAKE